MKINAVCNIKQVHEELHFIVNNPDMALSYSHDYCDVTPVHICEAIHGVAGLCGLTCARFAYELAHELHHLENGERIVVGVTEEGVYEIIDRYCDAWYFENVADIYIFERPVCLSSIYNIEAYKVVITKL
ncbi:MAG: hypothetical protein IKB68_06350 [Rikenellaceae bacterium]|nr:hypothetical protein [Rikenellaceae bacterium]